MPCNLSHTSPDHLARMMQLDAHSAETWSADDLAAILRHQLAAPLAGDLARLQPDGADQARPLLAAAGGQVVSFADLLAHPAPPVELLEMAKRFCKARLNAGDEPAPGEVFTLLYYAVITVALVRCGQRLSQLDDAKLQRGLDWGLRQAWVDASLRSLLRQGLDFLGAAARPAPGSRPD
jgi:hypothetical protein